MELRRYLGMLRRRLWLVVALIVVGAIAGDLATSQKTEYSSTATVYIGASNYQLNSPSGISTGADQQLLTTELIPTYQRMLHSQPIAAEAASLSGFPVSASQVLADTSVSNQTNTTLLDVVATDANPSIAQAEANSVADAFINKIQALQPSTALGSVPIAPAYVFQSARYPSSPLPAKTKGNIVKGALVGLVLGIGLAGLLEYLDVTVKGASDAEDRLDVPVLGVIPLRKADG